MGMHAQPLLHEDDVVQSRKDGEEKGGAKKYRARDPDQTYRLDLQQKDEKHRTDLRERVCFTKDAGAKVPKSRNGKQNGARGQNGDIAAENQNGIFPGNFVKDGEHKEHRAEKKFVSDGVQ